MAALALGTAVAALLMRITGLPVAAGVFASADAGGGALVGTGGGPACSAPEAAANPIFGRGALAGGGANVGTGGAFSAPPAAEPGCCADARGCGGAAATAGTQGM